MPSAPPVAQVKLRLRVPEGHRIRSVTADGKRWEQFDAEQETVTVPPAAKGRVALTVNY
jgi:aminopeptidase N